jgi:hypothetical protein
MLTLAIAISPDEQNSGISSLLLDVLRNGFLVLVANSAKLSSD